MFSVSGQDRVQFWSFPLHIINVMTQAVVLFSDGSSGRQVASKHTIVVGVVIVVRWHTSCMAHTGHCRRMSSSKNVQFFSFGHNMENVWMNWLFSFNWERERNHRERAFKVTL